MTLLLLASTTSWTVGKHYCMDRLMDVSFFADADDCGMGMAFSEGISETEEKNSCCDDEIVIVEGQDDLKLSFDQLTFDQQLFVASFVPSNINLFEGLEENVAPFRDYSPPPLIRDVQILDQTFLI